MKRLQVCSALLLGLLLGACNTSSSQPPPTTQPPTPPVTTPPVTIPPVVTPAPVAGSSWQTAIALSYNTASSKTTFSGSPTWYKIDGKKDDLLEISVRTQSQYPDSTMDSQAALYPPIVNQFTAPVAGNDDYTKEGADFGSKFRYTLTADSSYYLQVTSFYQSAGKPDTGTNNVYDVIVKKIVPATLTLVVPNK